MDNRIRVFKVRQGLDYDSEVSVSDMSRNDICFFRFAGGNISETDTMAEQLYQLKSIGVFLIGVFRFPFRFEGKKRLQTAIIQYHRMKALCEAITYINADGMLEGVTDEVPLGEAYEAFDWLEEGPIRTIEDLMNTTGQVNIDVHDIKTFLTGSPGVSYIRTFEGDTFDEPLKYVLNAPYLPENYTEGQQIMINMGCAQDVPMDAFQQMSLRLNDLFHKCELFKLGTYFLDDANCRFRITLMVNGIADPFTPPESLQRFTIPRLWVKKHWQFLKNNSRGDASHIRKQLVSGRVMSMTEHDGKRVTETAKPVDKKLRAH